MAIAIIIMGGLVLIATAVCMCIVITQRDQLRHVQAMKQLEIDTRLLLSKETR